MLFRSLKIYQTAVQYQFVHALALIGYGLYLRIYEAVSKWPGYCFVGGTLIFSGSLYLLVFTSITKFGAITPIGGLLFLAGWAGFLKQTFHPNAEK